VFKKSKINQNLKTFFIYTTFLYKLTYVHLLSFTFFIANIWFLLDVLKDICYIYLNNF